MSKKFNKTEVLEYIHTNKNILEKYFINGNFDVFNEDHLKVLHEIERDS